MYAKIFQQIYSSSIAEDYKQRFVFMDLLVLADQNGVVDMTHEGISRFTNVPVEIVREAIAVLESPDPKSRNQNEGGARIKRLDEHRDWGWWIVNYERYRIIASEEQRRENNRLRVARFKEKRNGNVANAVTLGNASVTLANGDNAKQKQKQKQKEEENAASLPLEARIWNSFCGSLPKVQHIGSQRMKHLENRRKDEYWRTHFEAAVKKLAASRFCCGDNDRGWRADFTFLVERPGAIEKIMEGKYDNRQNNAFNQRGGRPGSDRNAGTANENHIGDYDGVGKVLRVFNGR